MNPTINLCANCGKETTSNRCRLKKVYYCSRQCHNEYLGLTYPVDHKICYICKEDKPAIQFKLSKPGKGWKICNMCPYCDDCDRKRVRDYYSSKDVKAIKIRQAYGLSEDDYYAMLHEQDNSCAICDLYFESPSMANVDHNHITQTVRGILCFPCNTALGLFRESIALLLGAKTYLLEHE